MRLSVLQQLLPLLLWLPLTALQAQTADPIVQIFTDWQESADAPGGVFGIIEKGQVVMTRAYGKASLEYDVANTRETAMNIASVSKQFTAYAMVLLEQQGKLSIDDDVRKHLPELPDFGTPITIRHLLTHTSGLRNFQNLLAIAGWRDGDYMTNDDLVRYMAMQRELNFPVGSEYLYCNSGFNLCTEIVKRVTGQSFEDWTREHIFQPLGMTRSEFRSDMQQVVKQTATSYDRHPDGSFAQPLKYWTYTGNGNIYTTVDDLARWIHNFDEGTLGGKAALERLSERGILTNGDTLTYALGIINTTYRGLRLLQHGGSVGGYRAQLLYFPDQQTGIVVLSNFSAGNPGPKAYALADLQLASHFTQPKERPAERSTPAPQIPEGNYCLLSGDQIATAHLRSENGTLLLETELLPRQTLALQPGTNNRYRNEDQDVTLSLQGSAFSLQIQQTRYQARPLEAAMLQAAELEKWTGEYYSPELDTRYHIRHQGGQLQVSHNRHGNFRLIPLSPDNAVAAPGFFRDISIERFANGAIKGIRVSNGRVRNLWLGKLD